MVTDRDVMFWLFSASVTGEDLTDEQIKSINAENLAAAYKLASEHSMAHLIYLPLKKNGLGDISPEITAKAKKAVYFASITSSMQDDELKNLKRVFDENKIPYIVLKGAYLRQFYPESWMRIGCDVDILVKRENLEFARDIAVEKLGYKSELIMEHDVTLKVPNGLHFELHFDLLEKEELPSAHGILKKVWDYAEKKDENSYEYTLCNEYVYFYNNVHAAKHFVYGGCGVKPLVDSYILENIPLDRKLIDGFIEEADLKSFFENFTRLAKIRIGGENLDYDELLQQTEDFIIAGRTFGTIRSNSTAYAVQYSKGHKLITLLFLPYEKMKCLYPVLKKHKWLLPFMWVYRWFRAIFEGRMRLSVNRLRITNNISDESINETAKLLKDLDLN